MSKRGYVCPLEHTYLFHEEAFVPKWIFDFLIVLVVHKDSLILSSGNIEGNPIEEFEGKVDFIFVTKHDGHDTIFSLPRPGMSSILAY